VTARAALRTATLDDTPMLEQLLPGGLTIDFIPMRKSPL